MAEHAQVTSVEAIESFRASLIVFLSKVRPTLEEISDEVMRLQFWLQNDQRRLWESELRKRGLKLEEAKREKFNTSLSHLQEATALQNMAVQRAQRAVRDAEDKLDTLKKWERDWRPHGSDGQTTGGVPGISDRRDGEGGHATGSNHHGPGGLHQTRHPEPGRSAAMNLSGNKSRLVASARELSLKWTETKNYWRDEKSREFEHRYLEELFIRVDKTVAIIEKLDEILKKVRSDCE